MESGRESGTTRPHSGFEVHPIRWDPETVARLWEYYAVNRPFSDHFFSKVHGPAILRCSKLPLNTALRVLDMGCGPGYLWDHISALAPGWEYMGLDSSAHAIETLRRKGGGRKGFLGAELLAFPSPVPSGQFDVVLLIEVIEHLNDVQLIGLLESSMQALKPGGLLLITTPNDEDLNRSVKLCPECGAVFHEWQHVRSWDQERLRALLTSLGLVESRMKVLDLSSRGLLEAAYRWLQRARRLWRPPHLLALFRKPAE
jgi:2-polyprenyl-3-methyl-5-hydroxy-6-metoxy-1,4-benzoquinol methylase